MLTEAKINMDFRQAMAQADKVDNLADRLSQVANDQLGDTLQNLSYGWKGDNAEAYLKKGARLQGKITMSSSDLHSIASSIRTAAQRIYNAEMQALDIARNRSY